MATKIKGIKITGEKTVIANLNRLAARAPKLAGGALLIEAEKIMTSSKESFVPHDLGALKASGQVQKPPTVLPFGASVKMGYGGVAGAGSDKDNPARYALAIHEHPSPASPPSWRSGVTFKSGGPKYLERPLRNAIPGMAVRLAATIRAGLKV